MDETIINPVIVTHIYTRFPVMINDVMVVFLNANGLLRKIHQTFCIQR